MPDIDYAELKRAADSDKDVGNIFKHFAKNPTTQYGMSMRSIENAFRKKGSAMPRPKIRRFFDALVKAGAGKLKENGPNDIKIDALVDDTRTIGQTVLDETKNVRRATEDREERGIDRAAKAVTSGMDLKVYPMRRASSVSITLTINGKEIVMPLPGDLTPDMLHTLIERLKRVEDGYDPRKK